MKANPRDRGPGRSHAMSVHVFEDAAEFRAMLGTWEPLRRVWEATYDELDAFPGYCVVCDAWKTFSMPRPPDGGWRNLRESFLCTCGLNGRMRAAYRLLDQELTARPGASTLMMEQVTALYAAIRRQHPDVKGCEYLGPNRKPGETVWRGLERIRHEDLQALSFPDASLDVVFHADVLEHVPDHRKALRECARVLRPGGTLVFCCPAFDLDEHEVRASVVEGRLVHHLPPAYHGNPVSREGALVFTHFGWPLRDDIAQAGFSSVRIVLTYDPFEGIVSTNNPYREGQMWPFFFRATR